MKTPDTTTKAMPSAHHTERDFTGASPNRQQRAIAALLRGPVPREQLDAVTGQSNSPELVAELRRRGLAVPCLRVASIDRDGRTRYPGVYHLTTDDRYKIHRGFTAAEQGGSK